MWSEERIQEVIRRQNTFFRSGKTLDTAWRIRRLKRLRQAVCDHENEILAALRKDLGRAEAEGYFCDIGTVILEINEMIAGLPRWSRPETHASGIVCFPSTTTKVYKMPYGTVLLISPFNFPFTLTLGPLAAAIAGGNTAVIKTSSKTPACTAVLQKLIAEAFPEKYIAVIDGGHDTADLCLKQRFDKIFYTGSPRIGKHVMACASEHLTPVALELGGETGNWCVIRKDADIRDAARKIAFFKMCNSGQICININQVAVAEEIADQFIDALKKEITRQIGTDPVKNDEYPRLITKEAWKKCADEADRYRSRIVFGGYGDPSGLKYAPTLIYPVSTDEDIVRHELFNPLLPIVPYKDSEVGQILSVIADREHGLALYLFTKDLKWAEQVMSTQQYGGGCINEVCLHMMVKGVPFGGTGHSGMGAYHGKWGFMEFTHPSTVLFGRTFGNLPLREHPYGGAAGAIKQKIIRLVER